MVKYNISFYNYVNDYVDSDSFYGECLPRIGEDVRHNMLEYRVHRIIHDKDTDDIFMRAKVV